MHDDDYHVRSGVLRSLANKQKEAVETWTIVRDAATTDESRDVRTSALELLWREKKSDPGTRILLEKVALNDSNSFVRATALGFLASQNESVDIIKTWVVKLLSSVDEVDVRSRQFVIIAANIVETPMQQRLLTGELNNRQPFLDPLKPVLTKQARKAASILRISEVEARTAYEALAELIAAKLGIELELEWRTVLQGECDPTGAG
jgi:hypothetical protein